MIYPATVRLTALRHSTFDYRVGITGMNLAGAGLAMQVRLYPDAPFDPILSLVNAAPPADGLSVTVTEEGGVVRSEVRILVSRLNINGILLGNLPVGGAPLKLAYDLVTTGIGSGADRLMEGEFIIKQGVTQYG